MPLTVGRICSSPASMYPKSTMLYGINSGRSWCAFMNSASSAPARLSFGSHDALQLLGLVPFGALRDVQPTSFSRKLLTCIFCGCCCLCTMFPAVAMPHDCWVCLPRKLQQDVERILHESRSDEVSSLSPPVCFYCGQHKCET